VKVLHCRLYTYEMLKTVSSSKPASCNWWIMYQWISVIFMEKSNILIEQLVHTKSNDEINTLLKVCRTPEGIHKHYKSDLKQNTHTHSKRYPNTWYQWIHWYNSYLYYDMVMYTCAWIFIKPCFVKNDNDFQLTFQVEQSLDLEAQQNVEVWI